RGALTAPGQAADAAGHRHHVHAHLVGPPVPDAGAAAGRYGGGAKVTVRWDYPAGHAVTSQVNLTRPLLPDGTLPVWVTDRGELSSPPPSRVGLALLGVAIGTGSTLVLGSAVLSWYYLRRQVLDRRCQREWAAGWAAVEPHWSGRLNGHPGNPAP
ncbi:hypothetical protein, partial [Kitasatospora sp. LaBMicrA B282]|uniref:hypothetical protein n=1 Tax=Kitasatospora sp. LaBMicrA B282 TaxID=3420949 RepID=UPI003D0AB3CA